MTTPGRVSSTVPDCEYSWLGRVPYEDAWSLQRRMALERACGERPDTLLLLEHDPVYTTGKREALSNLRRPESMLGAPLVRTDRGGDITFHGPGQLVAYPIVDLRAARLGVVDYVRGLESVIVGTLGDYGIAAATVRGLTGVWVVSEGDLSACENSCLPHAPAGAEKIAAIGVRVSRPAGGRGPWVTTHGLALNVAVDLEWFARIVPCGITDCGVTSMQRRLGAAPDVKEVGERLAARFGEVFGRRMQTVNSLLTVFSGPVSGPG